jgi:hypothetical protein
MMLVHCSRGATEVLSGARWRDMLTGTEWEVVEPTGEAIYSPSGFGGTPCFWCRPITGNDMSDVRRWLETARGDGCVSFCGDSIAAALMAGPALDNLPNLRRSP